MVVSRCGMPLGYEVFAGNTADVTTVEHIVTTMEARYGKSDRIWVMDRGMVSEDNINFLRKGGRRYIVGTPKSMLKKYEAELLKDDWHTIRDGLEVKLCPRPRADDNTPPANDDSAAGEDNAVEDGETFILCRSRDRSKKEEAMVRRFEQKIEQRLAAMTARCEKQDRDPMKVEREIGRLLGQNTRAAKLFDVTVEKTADGYARLQWKKVEASRDWVAPRQNRIVVRGISNLQTARYRDEEPFSFEVSCVAVDPAPVVPDPDDLSGPLDVAAPAGSGCEVLPEQPTKEARKTTATTYRA